MAHVAITSDLNGTIFTLDHTGDLYRNRHAYDNPAGPLLHPGLGVQVGSGWGDVTHLAAVHTGTQVILAGLVNGALQASVAPPAGNGEFGPVAAPQPVTNVEATPSATAGSSPTPNAVAYPTLRSLFPGAPGVLFMVTTEGALLRQTFAGGSTPSGTASGTSTSTSTTGANAPAASTAVATPTAPFEVIEPNGWADGMGVLTNGDQTFFALTLNGTLRYQTLRTPMDAPSNSAWVTLASAWSRYHRVFAAGRNALYVIGSEGTLELRPFSVAANGAVTLEPRKNAYVVGSGMFPWAGLSADIEGYTWPLSYQPGDTVAVKVGTRLSLPPDGVPKEVPDPAYYTVDVRRLRRMQGGVEANYDEVKPTPLPGQKFLAARYLPAPNLLTEGAGWADSFSFSIPELPPSDPNYWRSGVYAARCTDTSNRDFYVSFIVRNKAARNPFAVIANSNTWNAYNSWGGQGKYTHTYPMPETLPFLRPHPGLTPDVAQVAPGLKQYGPSVLTNSCHLLRAELWILGWLEDLGPKYAYDMYTDQDLHAGIAGIGDGAATRYKGLILNTHPEYWTRDMYDHVKAYRDQGGSVVYLAGNGIYEEVVPSPDGKLMGILPGVDRAKFPYNCSNEQLRLYCLMRTPYVNRPEAALLGVGFQNCEQGAVEGQPYVLQQEPGAAGSNAVLNGVTLHLGDEIGAMSVDVDAPTAGSSVIHTYHADGWEVDQRGYGTPHNAYAVNSLLALGKNAAISGDMLCYNTDAGGVVFAGSSINFGGSMVADVNLQRIVQNVLDQCLAR